MPSIYVNADAELPVRREKDFYPTESALVRATLQHLEDCRPYKWLLEDRTMYILDPGAGNGVWGECARVFFEALGFKVYLVGVEIQDTFSPNPAYDEWHTADYLTWDDDRAFDLIIGNPPFVFAEEFVRLSHTRLRKQGSVRGKLIFLLPLDFQASEGRFNGLHKEFPFFATHTTARRPSFTQDGGTGGTAYAIFEWHPPYGAQHTWQAYLFTYEPDPADLVPELVELRRQKQKLARERNTARKAKANGTSADAVPADGDELEAVAG